MVIRLGLFAALLAGLAMPSLAAEDNAPLGRELVESYCSACHNIDAAGDSPHEGAPPFRTLHTRYAVEDLTEGLVEGLVSGHPDMPEFEFDPIQAEAIVAYIKSLTPAGVQ
jgi:cytochrome c